MNPRIRELADKIWTEEYWDNPNTDKLLPAQLNKFAELIVRECCGAADDWYQKHSELHWDPAQHIRNHFGVEE